MILVRAPADESTHIAPIQDITGVYLSAIDRVNNAPERESNCLDIDLDQ